MIEPRRGRIRKQDRYSPGSARRRQEYFNCQLASCRKYLYKVGLVISAFNLMLLIPDTLFIGGVKSKVYVIVFRILFSLSLALFSLIFPRIRTFRTYYWMITANELTGIALFLFVLNQYAPPDYLIQSAGLNVILLTIFLFPNQFWNSLTVSVIGTVGFLYFAYVRIGGMSAGELAASIVYDSATIYLCSVYVLGRDRQQYREFLSRTQLIRLSFTDRLTNASSRNRLFSEFPRWQRICVRQQMPLSLSLFDIDRFKSVNDRYGHMLADDVLIELARVIRRHLRSTDLLVRWGGDEFVILFPQTDEKAACGILERIRKNVEKHLFAEQIRITCSFGVAEMESGSTLDTMVQKADDRMYAGKRLGGNRVEPAQEKEDQLS